MRNSRPLPSPSAAAVSFMRRLRVIFAVAEVTIPTTVAWVPGSSVAISVGPPYVSNPNGSVSSRSRTVLIPSLASRLALSGPTFGSCSTDASSARGRTSSAIYRIFRFTTLVLRKRIEIAAIAILTLGIIGYGALGFALAGDRITGAERTLNTVVSHQNTLNSTFSDINIQLTTLNGSGSFDARQALILTDRSVANSQLAMQTINDDDASLGASERRLRDQRWLMLVGGSGLDRESTRMAHARRALAVARIVAADQVLHGRFWRALYAGLADLRDLNAQALAGDMTSARSTLGHMKSDLDTADGLSTSPGLPADLHEMTAVLMKFVQDYGKQLDAEVAGDDAAAAAQRATVSADVASLRKDHVDRVGGEIAAVVKPM